MAWLQPSTAMLAAAASLSLQMCAGGDVWSLTWLWVGSSSGDAAAAPKQQWGGCVLCCCAYATVCAAAVSGASASMLSAPGLFLFCLHFVFSSFVGVLGRIALLCFRCRCAASRAAGNGLCSD